MATDDDGKTNGATLNPKFCLIIAAGVFDRLFDLMLVVTLVAKLQFWFPLVYLSTICLPAVFYLSHKQNEGWSIWVHDCFLNFSRMKKVLTKKS